ncbi:unnamed protein product, partial [Iphiclides podalirius]
MPRQREGGGGGGVKRGGRAEASRQKRRKFGDDTPLICYSNMTFLDSGRILSSLQRYARGIVLNRFALCVVKPPNERGWDEINPLISRCSVGESTTGPVHRAPAGPNARDRSGWLPVQRPLRPPEQTLRTRTSRR